MSVFTAIDVKQLVGREIDRLNYQERAALTGKWVALEIYSPQTTPLRNIQAVGDSVGECARQLTARGLDPFKFEFSKLVPLD